MKLARIYFDIVYTKTIGFLLRWLCWHDLKSFQAQINTTEKYLV